jgi:cation diffusion facilitator CzcD-associated flavoprotein CzcO
VSGFPNLFVLYGPNTNLGHNSIIFMLERQIAYALTCIRRP